LKILSYLKAVDSLTPEPGNLPLESNSCHTAEVISIQNVPASARILQGNNRFIMFGMDVLT